MKAPTEAEMPFIKNLASSDRKLRVASLSSLQAFLSSRQTLAPLDARKLWTGLFFALYMTDRPLPQQRLTTDLAALVTVLPTTAAASSFLDGFWAVICERWTSIDVLRMEKFMLLVRRVFAAHVRWAKEGGAEAVDSVLELFEVWPLEREGDLRKVPMGVRLHVLDLWVDELEREGLLAADDEEEGGNSEASKAFVEAVGMLVEELKHSPIKSVRERARESYEDEKLPWGTKPHAEDQDQDMDADEDGSEDGWGGFDD